MRRFTLSVIVLACVASSALGQQDTTPPVLLEFSMAPTAFDTGPGPVTLTACARVQDDLSGGKFLDVQVCTMNAPDLVPPGITCSGTRFFLFLAPESDPRFSSGCAGFTEPRYLPYQSLALIISVLDNVNNGRAYSYADLCPIGTCRLENRPAGALPDRDGDGVSDDSDNCPDTTNLDQSDRDHDLIGDLCDPFPDDRDNEQAQCEADLVQCVARPVPDADGDGEGDATDRCSGTPSGETVDGDGCSRSQFCARFDASTRDGTRACKKADWSNDEPLMRVREAADCVVDKGASRESADDRCVPSTLP